MKKVVFTLLIICNIDCLGQIARAKFVEVPDYIELTGKIDSKYEISMLLYPSSKILFGKYWYNRVQKEISLKGSIEYIYGYINDKPYEKENIELYEYDELDNKKAIFKGELQYNSIFSGNWTDLSTKRTLPFELRISNFKPLGKMTNYVLETKIDSLTRIFNLPNWFPFKPSIDTLIWTKKESNYYCLLFVTYPSLGDCYSRGNCGCGTEQFLIYYIINDKSISQFHQVINYASCLASTDYSFEKNGRRTELSEFKLGDSNLYKILISNFSAKTETTYILNTDSLESGLRLISNNKIE